MTTYGLSSTGFLPKPLNVIRQELQAAFRNAFGASLDVGDASIEGQLIGILAERESLLWDLAQAVYSSQDPNAATGAALDALASLTGTLRPAAESSTVTLTLTGTPGTIVNSGSQAKTASTGAVFDTQSSITLLLLTSWAQSTTYSVGDRRTANSRCYQCITQGTSSNTGTGPATTASDITDGTAHWEYLGEGTAATDVFSKSDQTGPIVATSRDINVIVTPVVGWQTVTNLLDALPGRNVATDAELRTLRQFELAADGTATQDALRSVILKLTDVTTCTVFVNNTDSTVNGQPPHSVECLVQGGIAQTIFDTVFQSVAAGIATYGNQTGSSVDSQGTAHTVYFSRPTLVPIYVRVSLIEQASLYSGDTAVKAAIVAFGDEQSVGRDAVASNIVSAVLPVLSGGTLIQGVSGVLDVTEVLIYTDVIGTPVAWAGTTGYVNTPGAPSVVSNDGGRKYVCITSGTSAGSGGPTGTGTDITDGGAHWRYLGNTITISDHQLATYDTSRITVTSTTGTP